MGLPIPASYRSYAGKTAYYMSKCGMMMVALGAAAEGADAGITGNALWPATVVESSASENLELGDVGVAQGDHPRGRHRAPIVARRGAEAEGQLRDDVYRRRASARAAGRGRARGGRTSSLARLPGSARRAAARTCDEGPRGN